MLKNNFFTIQKIEIGDKYTAHIKLNAAHKIFEGHFPGNPITPGVCITQMVKETVEEITNKRLDIVTGDNIKFTAILNPIETPEVELNIVLKDKENGLLHADASLTAGTNSYFSFKGSYKESTTLEK
jgi:3-hydroxyacyl-[acyl-carrier-protein] dehydratase